MWSFRFKVQCIISKFKFILIFCYSVNLSCSYRFYNGVALDWVYLKYMVSCIIVYYVQHFLHLTLLSDSGTILSAQVGQPAYVFPIEIPMLWFSRSLSSSFKYCFYRWVERTSPWRTPWVMEKLRMVSPCHFTVDVSPWYRSAITSQNSKYTPKWHSLSICIWWLTMSNAFWISNVVTNSISFAEMFGTDFAQY
jgi:hypothetical protein